MRSRLPSPNHLVAFEAAARHLSFTVAARELNVTRVAVSHQIKALESFLGAALFHRLHRALALTREGELLRDAVSVSLERISVAVASIRGRDTDNRVTVTASTGFTTFWLLPRIGDFRLRHPGVDLRFLVSDSYLDLRFEGADVAIRYGDGDWPGLSLTRLTREMIFPACSPSYLRGRRICTIEDLRGETLLFLEGNYDPQTRWSFWFREHGIDLGEDVSGIHLNTYTNLVQATLDGQGIALIGPPVMERYLSDGSLIRLLDLAPVERRDFYLALPRELQPNSATQAFSDWVRSDFQSA